jgi:orotidine-5'-phosphate decarboxylase
MAMEKTLNYIPKNIFTIADAKRGDIGNTSSQYAKAFFETLNFDSITVAPYMGEDSVKPFLEYEGKWAIVLGLTSNKGAQDFELLRIVGENTNNGDTTNNGGDGGKMGGEDTHHGERDREKLYEKVLRTVATWGTSSNLMFVVGATQADEFVTIRKIVPDHFFLVPGVGAQGGSLQEISEKAMNKDIGLLVNVSRAIIYASANKDFADEARAITQQYQYEMKAYLG